MSEVGLVVNDFHVGHTAGIMPHSVVDDNDNEYTANPPQKELFEVWEEMKDEWKNPDFVIANGDLCEGTNRVEQGLGNWTTDSHLQVRVAVDLLASLGAKNYVITEGTGFHVGMNPSLDHQVADQLREKTGVKVRYGPDMAVLIKEENYRIHTCHMIGVSGAFHYRSTPIATELMAARLNEEEYGKFDGLLRGHAHYYVYLEFGQQWGAVTPGWKMKDAYLKRKGLKFVPKCGWFAFEIDHGELVTREKRIVVPSKKGLIEEFKI